MPLSDPKRQQIIAAIVARLAAITAGGSYFYTPSVGNDYRHNSEITQFPYYGVIEGEETNEYVTFSPFVETTMRVTIIGWISDAGDRRAAVNRAIGDVERAWVTDEKFGGLCFDSRIVSVRTDEAALFAKPFAYFEMDAEVIWQHAQNDI